MPTFGASDPQVVYSIFIHLYLLAKIVTMWSYGEELGLPSKKENCQLTLVSNLPVVTGKPYQQGRFYLI